jgi:hypothetical protein
MTMIVVQVVIVSITILITLIFTYKLKVTLLIVLSIMTLCWYTVGWASRQACRQISCPNAPMVTQ